MKLKFNSLPIYEQKQNEVRDSKISLVEEHTSRDAAIQNEIRKTHSLSEELSIIRKEIFILRTALDLPDDEFTDFYKTVEEAKKYVKEQNNTDYSTTKEDE